MTQINSRYLMADGYIDRIFFLISIGKITKIKEKWQDKENHDEYHK